MGAREALTRSLRARELAGDSRAGSYARSRARNEQRAFIRERWGWLLFAWAILVAPVPVVWSFVPSELLRGVLLGGLVTGASAAIWFWVVQSTGTAPLMMGDEAEQWTAQALRKLGRDWRLVNRFVLSHGDMDHIAVGPAGAIVIETKWSAHAWASDEGLRRQRAAARQVEHAARQLRLWHDVKTSAVRVRPVVVLWGGATRQWGPEDCVRNVDGVAVVAGHGLRAWIHSLDAVEGDHREATYKVWRALEAQTRKREDREPDLFAVPLSAGDMVARLFWFVVAAALSFLTIAQVTSQTDSLFWTALAGMVLATGAGAGTNSRGWLGACAIGALVGAAFPTFVVAGAVVLAALL